MSCREKILVYFISRKGSKDKNAKPANFLAAFAFLSYFALCEPISKDLLILL